MSDIKENNADFLNDYAGDGLNEIKMDDLNIPFLRIIQKLSPQIDETSSDYIEHAKVGMFFNTITKKLYGMEINLVPFKYQKVWIEWKPNRGGFVASHKPDSIPVDQSDFSEWKYNNNIIQETLLFYVIIADHPEEGPLVFALSSTGIKHGKTWNNLITNTRLPNGDRAPIYASVWNIQSVLCSNEQGSWYQIGSKSAAIKRVGFINKELFTTCVQPLRKEIANKTVDLKQLENSSNKEDLDTVPY
ncbi:MAG: hypothetical protein P8Y70_00195 [Candidatus Lokiarchaeota archaeon]